MEEIIIKIQSLFQELEALVNKNKAKQSELDNKIIEVDIVKSTLDQLTKDVKVREFAVKDIEDLVALKKEIENGKAELSIAKAKFAEDQKAFADYSLAVSLENNSKKETLDAGLDKLAKDQEELNSKMASYKDEVFAEIAKKLA